VTNQTSSPVAVVTPDVGTPPEELNWTFSKETYQISLLLSFRLMGISLISPSGERLPMVAPYPWVTPILLPRRQLAPGDSFSLQINLNDHFELQQAGKYHLTIEYGDEHAFAHVETELVIESKGR
jgi:hypothetical protein